jgi:Cys-tRNA synthase (O-phospho-L-seryl-tRNA:Cys-tRNA synthase)
MGIYPSRDIVIVSDSVDIYQDHITNITNESVVITIDGTQYPQRYHPTIKHETVKILKESKESGRTFSLLTHGKYIYGILSGDAWNIKRVLVLSDLVKWNSYRYEYYIEKQSL